MNTQKVKIILNTLVLLTLLAGFSMGEAGAANLSTLGEASPQVIPTVTSITPDYGFNTGAISITNLAGSNFETGATVSLTKTGETDIIASNVVVVDASWITCDFDLLGAALGKWNVVVTNPGELSGQLDNGFTIDGKLYMPLIMKRWPPTPDIPVLYAISNSEGINDYYVSWSSAYLATLYVLEEDEDAAFSSPITRYNGPSTTSPIADQPVGTFYYRVKATNSWGSSGWSNIQSTTVVPPPPPQSNVYVYNDTGCTLCFEIYGTGIGEKCFTSAGSNYYGSIPVGTYTWHASACCGSMDDTDYFNEGYWENYFYCSSGAGPQEGSQGLQCALGSNNLAQP